MRTAQINVILENTLSRERLDKYIIATPDIHSALSLYERNLRLSEAFYSPLQCFEVCLRNKLHQELTNTYGADWYSNGLAPLNGGALAKIQDAIQEITQGGAVFSVGDVVAELSLGFWVAILGPSYDATIWRQSLTRAFRDGGRGMSRGRVHSRVNAIRRFRNRIMHHEPIFTKNLTQVHNELIETMSWMCPDTARWARHHSRVPAVITAP